jgi:DNA processing protein
MEALTPRQADRQREVDAALTLCAIPGFGPATIRRLIDHHGSASSALKAHGETTGEAVADVSPGSRLLTYGSAGYPERLHRLHHPPIVLWVQGPLPVDAARAVAIVGTREATAGGRTLAHRISSELAASGVRIVSGLARGIDAAAHRGALDAGGETIGVLGSGLNFEYPRANRFLYAELRSRGALVTEFPPAERPRPHQFPRRNRIVAALCDAVLVVQAGERSGARITAMHAADIGVDVLACPGQVGLPASAGCHSLLRDGAGIVTCAADVMEALSWPGARSVVESRGHEADAITGGAETRTILARLREGQSSLDQLIQLVGDPGQTLASLGRLEALGMVRAASGARFEMIS